MSVVWWISWGLDVWFASHTVAIGVYAISCGSYVFVWLFDFECADPDDVLECSLLKYTEESEESR